MTNLRMIFASCLLVISLLLGSSQPILAQGPIAGLVERSNGTVPPDGSVLFIGYVNNTDNEIHLSGSVGADYDGGHWYDDFQNYLFAPAGLPYTYHIFDTTTLESASLDSLISSDGFQEHDLTLAPAAWPDPPQEVKLARDFDGQVHLRWLSDSSTTVHIYRRVVPSEGSFFRLDDPSGTILGADPSTDNFSDLSAEYGIGYTYLLLAVDQSGEFSPPVIVHGAPADCCGLYTGGFPGNTTGGTDGKRNLADITLLIDRIYLSKNLLWCEPDGNINGDVEQKLNLADITRMIDHVYLTKAELGPCAF